MFPILNINRLLITWCSSVVSSKNSRKRISMIGVLPHAFLEHGNNRNMCLDIILPGSWLAVDAFNVSTVLNSVF